MMQAWLMKDGQSKYSDHCCSFINDIIKIVVKRQGLGRVSLDHNRLLPSDRGASLRWGVGLEACRKDLGE